MTKKTVALLFGGVSSEHEVSCMSAASVARNIDREKYEVLLLGITLAGEWYLYDGDIESIETAEWAERTECLTPAFISPDRTTHGIVILRNGDAETKRVDIVYPVLHGKNGEDGTMQGLLEIAGIPYVGCGVLASACCMDKEVCHVLLANAGVPQVEWLAFRRCSCPANPAAQISEKLGWPVFVKPANAGSSVGITKVKSAEGIPDAFGLAFRHDDKIIVERAVIDPIEIECAVLGNETCVFGGPGEVVPADEFYTYDAKYSNAESRTYLEARIEPSAAEQVRKIAELAYHALGCAGLARVDFLMERGSGKIVLNEPNTLPGFTKISMYPKLMVASGMTYSALIDRLLGLAEER